MQISSQFPTVQDLFKQLEESLSKVGQRPAEAGTTTPAALPATDSYESSLAAADATNPADATEAVDQQQESGGLQISFHFDLFYKLSQKIQTRMGQSGQDRFAETTSNVAETFKGNFSLQIDAVGSFLKGTDSALNISDETTNEFLDAVDGLAELSPESLENFLKEAGEFFDELESTYGEAGGAFDDIKAQMQAQAKAFFDGVKTIRGESGEAAETEAIPAVTEPASEEETGKSALTIKLAVGQQQDIEVSEDQYQKFIDSFLEYMRRYKETFINEMTKGNQSTEKSSDSSSSSEKSSSDLKPSVEDLTVGNGQYPILPNTPNGKFPSGYYFSVEKSTSVFIRADSIQAGQEKAQSISKVDTSA